MQTPPPPDSDEYTRMVWELATSRRSLLGHGNTLGLVRIVAPPALSSDPWVRRYLECHSRSAAGMPIGGETRTGWLKRQRLAHSAGSLPAGRAALLERLEGFTWTPDADRWQSSFARVQDFAARRGRIPTRGDDAALASWLASQRLTLRRGKLDPRRASALDTLPGWRESLTSPRTRGRWLARLSELERFLSLHGRYPDPRSPDEKESSLARWVVRQRESQQRSDLSPRRAAALEALPGWRWSSRDAAFDRRVFDLERELGGGPIPTGHRFYRWVVDQRRRHREGRLSPDQVKALDALGLLGDALSRNRSAA